MLKLYLDVEKRSHVIIDFIDQNVLSFVLQETLSIYDFFMLKKEKKGVYLCITSPYLLCFFFYKIVRYWLFIYTFTSDLVCEKTRYDLKTSGSVESVNKNVGNFTFKIHVVFTGQSSDSFRVSGTGRGRTLSNKFIWDKSAIQFSRCLLFISWSTVVDERHLSPYLDLDSTSVVLPVWKSGLLDGRDRRCEKEFFFTYIKYYIRRESPREW